MSCTSLLSGAINANCPATPKGFEQDANIYNKAEIETLTYDVTTGLCSSIVMKTGKKGYPLTIRGLKPFESFKTNGVQKPFGMQFESEVSLIIIGNTPASSAIVKILTQGEFVLIINQKGVIDNSRNAIVGLETGLIATGSTLEPYSDNGGWVVPMKESMKDAAGVFVYNTDRATTDAMIAATLD